MGEIQILLAVFGYLANGFVFWIRYRHRKAFTVHRVLRFFLIFCNALCCLFLFIISSTQTNIDVSQSSLNNISQKQSCPTHFNSSYNCSKTDNTFHSIICQAADFMQKKDLCYLQLSPLFFVLMVDWLPFLGNFLTYPLYILDQVVRIYMALFSVYKVVVIRFCLSRSSKKPVSRPILWSFLHILIMISIAAAFNGAFFGLIYIKLSQLGKENYLVVMTATLLYFPLGCQLLVVIWYLYIVLGAKCSCLRDVDRNDTKGERKMGDSGFDEPGYQSWLGVNQAGPSSLQELPSVAALNLVPEPKTTTETPIQTENTKVTWNSLPEKLKIVVKHFLHTVVFYVAGHMVAVVLTFAQDHDDIISKLQSGKTLSIRWVVPFVDFMLMFLCLEEFVLLWRTRKWRRRSIRALKRIIRFLCSPCLGSEEEVEDPTHSVPTEDLS